MPRMRRTGFILFIIVIIGGQDLLAQACQGTPRGRGFWVERGEMSLGNTIGGGGALGGKSFAVSASFRHQDVSDAVSGDEATLRIGPIVRAGALQLCPVLTLNGQRQEWQVDSDVSLTTNRVAASGGLGVGVELPIIGDLSVIPHAIGQYEYAGTYFKFEGVDGDTDESGVHRGRVDLEFGLLGRFKFFYGGVRSHYAPESKRAYLTQFIAGIAL